MTGVFKRSAIGVKCQCGVPEIVCREHSFKRFLVPAGYYGDLWQPNQYYMAAWWTLECEQCHNRREDFFVWKWHGDGSCTFVDGVFQDKKRKLRYPDIYRAILNMLPE